MPEKDYYGILGLGSKASADEVKKAYRQLAMQYHPDRNRGREEWANGKFKEINEAFGVLFDPKKRRLYDRSGRAGNTGGNAGSQAGQTAIEDLLRDLGAAGPGIRAFDDVLDHGLGGTGFAAWRFRRYGGIGALGAEASGNNHGED